MECFGRLYVFPFPWFIGLVLTLAIGYHCVVDSSHFTSKESLRLILGCRSLRGDLRITDFVDSSISLDNVEFIEGSLIIKNSTELKVFSAPRLHTITQAFEMNGLAALTAVEIPKLRNLHGLIWRVAPLLNEVIWESLKGVENITIVDTLIRHLAGFSAQQIHSFDVNNNRYLEHVSFNFSEVSHSFQLTGNARNLEASFPRLTIANNITVSDVTNLQMDSLCVVTGSMNLLRNKFSRVSFPSLASVGESFKISGNLQLSEASFDQLSKIGGGLVISNNTALEVIDFFPSLEVIDGALEIDGNIKSTAWDSLRLVKGSIKLYSINVAFDCLAKATENLRNTLNGGAFECKHTNTPGQSDFAQGLQMSGSIHQKMVCVVILTICFILSILV